jgi:hypothetical protein
MEFKIDSDICSLIWMKFGRSGDPEREISDIVSCGRIGAGDSYSCKGTLLVTGRCNSSVKKFSNRI